MSLGFIGRVTFGFLTGAAIAALAAGSLVSFLFLLGWIDKFHPLIFTLVPVIMQVTFMVCSVIFIINAPIVFLFAYLYRGPVAGALAIGAAAGGGEAYWLAAWFDRPNYGDDEYLTFVGAVSGAIIAWRVWTEIRLPATIGWTPPAPPPRAPPTES